MANGAFGKTSSYGKFLQRCRLHSTGKKTDNVRRITAYKVYSKKKEQLSDHILEYNEHSGEFDSEVDETRSVVSYSEEDSEYDIESHVT